MRHGLFVCIFRGSEQRTLKIIIKKTALTHEKIIVCVNECVNEIITRYRAQPWFFSLFIVWLRAIYKDGIDVWLLVWPHRVSYTQHQLTESSLTVFVINYFSFWQRWTQPKVSETSQWFIKDQWTNAISAVTFFFREDSPLPLEFGAPLDNRIDKCDLEMILVLDSCSISTGVCVIVRKYERLGILVTHSFTHCSFQ